MVKHLEACIESGEGEKAVMGIIKELASYTQWHFRHEERLMLAGRYSGMAAHKEEHEALLVQVKQIHDDLDNPQKETIISTDLTAFLQNWLKDHILGTDHQLAVFLNKTDQGVKITKS